jgi:hypothetical protein
MFRKKPVTPAAATLFIQSAQQYLGYTAEQIGRNIFGEKVGYNAQPWAGAFVDVCAREAGLQLPSFVYTPAALAEFIRQGNFSRKPQLGSVAIYNFASETGHAASAFSMPHCGIVTDVREFESTGRFIAIEGNTEGTTTYTKKDGVHQKVRTVNDVAVFCHPKFEGPAAGETFNERLIKLLDRGRTTFNGEELIAINEAASKPSLLKINAEIKHGDRNRKIETIQLALATVTDLRGCELGKWDAVTAAACSRYQRIIGYVGKDVDGLPDLNTLKRLARDTGLFRLED